MDEIKGIARVKFHPGKVEEWKRLSEEAMEIVRTRDSGTLQYEIFFNEDESEAVVFERYRDADAAIEHFSNISHLMEPIILNGRPQIPADELRVPIDPVQGARHDVLLPRVDGPREGFRPVRHRHRPGRQPPPRLHHFVSHAAKEKGIGLGRCFPSRDDASLRPRSFPDDRSTRPM
jgi:quinol monooxygenase YgiN